MRERVEPRGPEGAGGWLESACKVILAARAGVLLLTLLSLMGEDDLGIVAVLLVIAALASFVPLRYWDRVGPTLVRHPLYLAAELMLTTLILLLTPVQSPFFYFTLGTALFGGLLYGYAGAAVFSLLLVAVYLWSLDVRAGVESIPDTVLASESCMSRASRARSASAAARPRSSASSASASAWRSSSRRAAAPAAATSG